MASQRSDEIGILSRELDAMLDKLARSRAAVVESARAAGMSEIATGILHNVGNVLNSVNVSTNLALERLRGSRAPHLERLAAVVGQHQAELATWVANDAQGQKLAPFLLALSRQISSEHGALEGELATLAVGVEHIRQLVDSQQAYATRSTLREPTALAEQLDQALKLTTRAGDASLEVVREYAAIGSVKLDRHKLLEILVNLVKNARESIEEAGVGAPRLILRVLEPEPGIARIEVEDNGIGIPPENMARIFNHGFTTKSSGHGFGLHAAANAATELDAKLNVRSPGPGRGATFILDIGARERAAA